MPEREQDSGGIISRDEIVALSALFDAYEFALDPLALKAREAEAHFEAQIKALYEGRVRGRFPSLTLPDFRAGVRSQCRLFLRKESLARRKTS